MTRHLAPVAAAIVLILPSIAGAHAGNTDPNAIHACVGILTKVARIVGVGVIPASGCRAAGREHRSGPRRQDPRGDDAVVNSPV
ncbi:MAG: hypothetical protein ACREMB_19135 [Candidatus Rokuibacteriota bacterium]